jgi:hypothetical protein
LFNVTPGTTGYAGMVLKGTLQQWRSDLTDFESQANPIGFEIRLFDIVEQMKKLFTIIFSLGPASSLIHEQSRTTIIVKHDKLLEKLTPHPQS